MTLPMIAPRRVVLATGLGLASVGLTTTALAVGGDDAASATLIPSLPFADTGDTSVGFTDQFDVACPFTGSTAPDAWYAYGPVADSVLTIDLCNSGYDTKVYVLDTDFNDLGCNDDACTSPSGGQFRSLLDTVQVDAGTTAYIVVDGWSGDAGAYDITITGSEPPPPCTIAGDCDGLDEGEPCQSGVPDVVNGGCNSSPPVFSFVSCGDTVCGNAWALGGTRDTDWFELQGFEGATLVTCTVAAEFSGQLLVNCTDCAAICVLAAASWGPCETVELSWIIDDGPGENVWWILARNGFDGLPCGGTPFEDNDYTISWTCGDVPCPELGDLDGNGAVDFGDILVILANWGSCP